MEISNEELIMMALAKILENQTSIQAGIIALAKKEGMEISFKDPELNLKKTFINDDEEEL